MDTVSPEGDHIVSPELDLKILAQDYVDIRLDNFDLWEQFHDDFKEWTEDAFKLPKNRLSLRVLRNALRKRGV
jgi:hypothetical protein